MNLQTTNRFNIKHVTEKSSVSSLRWSETYQNHRKQFSVVACFSADLSPSDGLCLSPGLCVVKPTKSHVI